MKEHAPHTPSHSRTDVPRARRDARSDLAALQRSAGNRAVSSLLAPEQARAVQRDPDDDWSLEGLGRMASSAVDSTEKGASDALNFVNTPMRNAAHSVDDVTKEYAGFIGDVEDAEHSIVHGAADAVGDVPVLGSMAQTAAGSVDMATQVVGGANEGAADLLGGLAKAFVDPVDAAKGVYGLAQKLPPAVMVGAGEQAIADLVTGKGLDTATADITGGVEKSFNNVWGGIAEGADPSKPDAAPKDAGIVRQMLNPFYGDVAKGKGAHAAGRAGANIAAIAFGGELAEAADAAVGSEAAVGTEAATGTEASAVAEEAAPATVRDPPVGDADSLSDAGQKAFDGALADGKSPGAAFDEAAALDEAAQANGLRGPRVAPEVRVDPSAFMPEGLSPDAQRLFRKFVESGTPPAEAERLVREIEARPELPENQIEPNARGTKARRGPKRII